MALYAITFNGDKDAEIVSGRDMVDVRLKEMFDDGYWQDGDTSPHVYKLEKKMTASVETKITLKGE